MADVHIVWDWNGTLLDDLDVVVEAVSRSVERYGHGPIDADVYRDHFTRPVRSFYDSLFGRSVDDMEWTDLNKTFHDNYHGDVDGAALGHDTVAALDLVSNHGWTQSLLSMSTHDELVRLVSHHRLSGYFLLVSGLPTATGDLKASYLRQHLDRMGVTTQSAVVIGDTPDDHHAAAEVGVRSVAYDGGSHHRDVLDRLGVPVADSLLNALEIVESLVRS